MKTIDTGELFSEQQAADIFGWSVDTMRKIRKRGEIEHLVFNEKTIRYTRTQLEAYKNKHVSEVTRTTCV